MPGGVTKCVDLQLGDCGLGNGGKKPVDDGGTFDTTLAVEYEDDFLEGGVLEGFFEDDPAAANIRGRVVEVPLNEAFDKVEEDAFAMVGERVLGNERKEQL